MGSNTSKTANETAVHVQRTDVDVADPRSPTPEIYRTPLQGKTGGKHNITKNADLRKAFEQGTEEKIIHNNPILSAVIKNHLQSFDPRSPTQDFERTPIIISNDGIATEKDKLRQQIADECASPHLKENSVHDTDNSNLTQQQYDSEVVTKNLCDGFFDLTLDDTLKEPEEPLGSSTASQEAIESNLSNNKSTKFLETNFDYVDDIICEHDAGGDKQDGNIKLSQYEILENDPRSPSIGIERTPIVVSKVDEPSEIPVEQMSDDMLIKALQNSNAGFRNTLKKVQTKNNDGLLIYEDETVNTVTNTPRKSVPEGNRTPLSCMKNKGDGIHVRSKSATTLDPTCKNLPPSRRVSHIPRLKSLSKPMKHSQVGSLSSLKSISKTSTVSGGCENTPPHSHRDKWDNDNSVVL